MSFAKQYAQSALNIIAGYDGSIPFHYYLQQYFAANKKYGSRDRKTITHFCYCCFRLGNALNDITAEEKIKAALFLCSNDITAWKALFTDEWLANHTDEVIKRIEFIQTQFASFNAADIFPLHEWLTEEVEKLPFILAHLMQPNLFLRTRPGKEKKVFEALTKAGLKFELLNRNCISLPNSTKVEDIIELNKDAVVQDYSSQRIAEFLSMVNSQRSTVSIWDCCAASGGKSILAYDVLKNVELTVSDVRPSIIQNLKKRFAEAGIKNYTAFVHDLAANLQPNNSSLMPKAFNLIICDAPCSGSGTWGRTPEQLSFFTEEKIDEYSLLQKKIVTNAIPHLAENGYFLYITCSVFKKENEEVVEYIKQHFHLELVKMEVLKGYDKKADTMFAVLFKSGR